MPCGYVYNVCINTGGSDYRQISTNVTFLPGSSTGDRACINVSAFSDGVLEASQELFQVMVSPLASQRHFVSVASPSGLETALVIIVDTNSK